MEFRGKGGQQNWNISDGDDMNQNLRKEEEKKTKAENLQASSGGFRLTEKHLPQNLNFET